MIVLNPSKSYKENLNFWEEYPGYKIHPLFSVLWRDNKTAGKLRESSDFMWALSLCYDRISPLYNQPEIDKWEVVCEQIFKQEDLFANWVEDIKSSDKVVLDTTKNFYEYIHTFEITIDSPLGIALRNLEKKLIERTTFITATPYTVDHYKQQGNKNVLVKGTADQLDKMFANTEKINSIVQTAMDNLKKSEVGGTAKGGENLSLGDGDSSF